MVFVASPTAPKLNGPGRPTANLRLVMGALLVQHVEALSDERTLELISENVYVQYFCGLPGFQCSPPFDASSLTHWRQWLGDAGASALSETLADVLEQRRKDEDKPKNDDSQNHNDPANGLSDSSEHSDSHKLSADKYTAAGEADPNQGTLMLDATCAPVDISFPKDTGLLNHARESLEMIIDTLWEGCQQNACGPQLKPRTYRQEARTCFAGFSRKRHHSRKAVRHQRRKQLQYVERDLKHIDMLLDSLVEAGAHIGVLTPREYKRLRVCHELARQQRLMHDAKVKRCDNRIVSLAQPHIRPIIRGKAGARVEFGPKLDMSISNGIARVESISFDAYHEGCIAIAACERYLQRHGYYPEKILVDKAYMSRLNRTYFKARGINCVGKPLGRPPLDPDKRARYEEQLKASQVAGERNPIEGLFGVAKRRYRLGRLMCRKAATTIGEVFLTATAYNLVSELKRVLDAFILLLVLSKMTPEGRNRY